jgi:hypothetical protein
MGRAKVFVTVYGFKEGDVDLQFAENFKGWKVMGVYDIGGFNVDDVLKIANGLAIGFTAPILVVRIAIVHRNDEFRNVISVNQGGPVYRVLSPSIVICNNYGNLVIPFQQFNGSVVNQSFRPAVND